MYGAHRSLAFAIACAVQTVLAVPGFSQSDSHRPPSGLDRTATSALRQYVAAGAVDASPQLVPPNLDPGIQLPVVEEMLKRSPTFRRQCWRITNTPHLQVVLRSVPRSPYGRVRARTKIARSKLEIMATVELFTPDHPQELIAHEFEHIIEQLDGVDLAIKASAEKSGVHRGEAPESSYETVRATRVGQTVAAEVRRQGN